jgi:hypothetical protein
VFVKRIPNQDDQRIINHPTILIGDRRPIAGR